MSMTIVAAVFVIMWVQNVRGLDRTRINLSDVAWPRGFTIDGDYPHSLLGSAVAIGDVTGDGVAEIIIGEESRPNQQVNPWVQSTGVIHILAGTNASGAAVDIERDSLTIAGEIANAGFGGRVGVAGDLDHDGVDDLFVSSLSPETHGGDVHIIFGGPELDTNGGHRLGAIPTASIRLRQPSSDDMLGWAVAAVGDVNSDGIDDLAIGAPTSDLPGFPNVGAVYVLFGSPALRVSTDLALTALDGRNGLAIHGDRAEEQFGRSIAAAGDLDGDGTPELAIGAPMEGVGRVHVFSFASFAESDHPSTSFREVSSRHRHVITGVAVGDGTGYSVANVSDVNGDGLDDLLIGAPQIARLNADAGIAYLVFGRPGIMATPEMPLIELDGRTGMTLSGHASHANGQGDLLGLLVAAAGDFDADGLSDLAIAAPRANSGGNDSGAVYLVFGSREPIEGGNLDLRNLAWPRGLILQGSANGDEAGSAIAFGDVNGDIVTDLVVGAPRADPSSTTDAGMVYAVYGKK